jgi:hypothetical protein
MINHMHIEEAREHFAHAIRTSELVPESATIEIRTDPALGEGAVLNCRWPIAKKGLFSRERSREITVQVTADAMNRFRAVDARAQGEMLARFRQIFNKRLADLHQDENKPPSTPLILYIDEHTFES